MHLKVVCILALLFAPVNSFALPSQHDTLVKRGGEVIKGAVSVTKELSHSGSIVKGSSEVRGVGLEAPRIKTSREIDLEYLAKVKKEDPVRYYTALGILRTVELGIVAGVGVGAWKAGEAIIDQQHKSQGSNDATSGSTGAIAPGTSSPPPNAPVIIAPPVIAPVINAPIVNAPVINAPPVNGEGQPCPKWSIRNKC